MNCICTYCKYKVTFNHHVYNYYLSYMSDLLHFGQDITRCNSSWNI